MTDLSYDLVIRRTLFSAMSFVSIRSKLAPAEATISTLPGNSLSDQASNLRFSCLDYARSYSFNFYCAGRLLQFLLNVGAMDVYYRLDH